MKSDYAKALEGSIQKNENEMIHSSLFWIALVSGVCIGFMLGVYVMS